MKKLIITSACVLAMISGAFAQGKINWSAISASAMTAATNSQTYSPLLGGGSTGSGATGPTAIAATGFYYQLLFGAFSGSQAAQPTSVSALSSGWTAIAGATGNNSATSAGRLVPITPNTSLTVPWAAGTTQSVMMAGWSANLGTTYAAALASLQAPGTIVGPGFFGLSNTGFIAGNAADPGVTVFATSGSGQGLPIFSLATPLYLVPVAAVPEPGTMALAGLGGLAMLALRRKK